MTRVAALVSAALLGWLPAQQAELRATLPAAGLVWGEPFELQVGVRWPGQPELAPLELRQLAPLQVELLGDEAAAAANGERVLRYRARALAIGDLTIGPVVVRAVSGAVVATSNALQMSVRSALPEPAGAIEWPGDVREPQSGGERQLVVVLVVVGGCVGLWWWRRPRRAVATGPLPPAEDLSARLLALPLPADAAALGVFYREIKALLRAHASQRHQVRADMATSEELLHKLPRRELLARCLGACDGVLFAARQPASDAHGAVRALAVEWIRGDPSVSA